MAAEESSLRLIGCNRNAVRRAARRLLRRKLRELKEKEEIELLEQVALPEDADLEHAMPLSPRDVETVEELDLDGLPTAWIEFSPDFHLREAGISDDAIAAFANEFGISDLAAARLTFAYAAEAIAGEGKTSDYAHIWRGQALDASHESYAEWQRADGLSWDLHELVRKADWPVGMAEPALRLLVALQAYGNWLAESTFGLLRKPKSRPPMAEQQQVVLFLALAWPRLTGKKPTVYPAKDGQKQLSRFHRACLRMCELFGLASPSASSIRTWKGAAERARVQSARAAKSEES
jgi:hypothetical protein